MLPQPHNIKPESKCEFRISGNLNLTQHEFSIPMHQSDDEFLRNVSRLLKIATSHFSLLAFKSSKNNYISIHHHASHSLMKACNKNNFMTTSGGLSLSLFRFTVYSFVLVNNNCFKFIELHPTESLKLHSLPAHKLCFSVKRKTKNDKLQKDVKINQAALCIQFFCDISALMLFKSCSRVVRVGREANDQKPGRLRQYNLSPQQMRCNWQ